MEGEATIDRLDGLMASKGLTAEEVGYGEWICGGCDAVVEAEWHLWSRELGDGTYRVIEYRVCMVCGDAVKTSDGVEDPWEGVTALPH